MLTIPGRMIPTTRRGPRTTTTVDTTDLRAIPARKLR
jgi:hypothetical protein